MADKFCIASGTFGDPAIWSDTDRGPGGASVPSASDARIFNVPVAVTEYVNAAANTGKITIGTDVSVSITPTTMIVSSGSAVNNHGKLSLSGTVVGCVLGGATFANHHGAVLNLSASFVFQGNGRFENHGTVSSAVATHVLFQTTDSSIRHSLGTIGSFRPQGTVSPVVVNVEDAVKSEIGIFSPVVLAANAMVTVRFYSPAAIGMISLQPVDGSAGLRIEQYAPIEVSGSVSTLTGPVQWTTGENATLTLVGTANQTVALPDTVTGQKWTVDKPAGKLTLTNFNGYLQGRLRSLVVEAASSVDLSGPSPYLLNSDGDWNYFQGLKADAFFSDSVHIHVDAETHERETMDSCINSGQITIPAGKVLCTKTFDNRVGAKVLGDGVLSVRYGGLTNLGTIASTITIHYYDRPVSIDLSLSPSSGHLPLTVRAEIETDFGDLYTFDWGNGHVLGPVNFRSAVYTYPEEGRYNVTVTAVDTEGTRLSTSAPVTVLSRAPAPRARLAIVPWQGDAPLDAVVSTEGSSGSEMTLDWGDGSPVLGPQTLIDGVDHRYETPGRFQAVLRVRSASGDVTEATQVVAVADPTKVRADLVLLPSSGEAPLTILADASASNGDEFTFHWGDGDVTDPQSEPRAVHTFDRPGYYSVILVTSKNSLTASVTRGVVVHLASTFPPSTLLPSNLGPVEIDPRDVPRGIPRGNLPSPYRYALAQGICYMNDTLQLFCPMNQSGRSTHNGSALFLGRVTHATGLPISLTSVEAASYTIFRLDDSDPAVRIPVEGHADVPLEIESVLHADTVVDENWPFDEIGYNFHHVLDDSTDSPFPVPGRNYLVSFVLRTNVEPPKILLQYRVHVH